MSNVVDPQLLARNRKHQMVAISPPISLDESPVYVNACVGKNPLLLVHPQTVFDFLEYALEKNGPNSPFLGARQPGHVDPITMKPVWSDYIWQTIGETRTRALNFGAGLRKIQLDVLKHNENVWKVGIYSYNRPEWLISDLGCQSQSLVSVALFDTLGPNSVEYIINHGQISVVTCSLERVPNIIKIAEKCPQLKVIISMDPIDGTIIVPGIPRAGNVLKQWATEKGLSLFYFKDVENIGEKSKIQIRLPKTDDICTLLYTSGTTGNPKGVILTHKNFRAGITNSNYTGIGINANDCYISYLPLGHVYERNNLMGAIFHGCRIGFSRGDLALLFEDIQALKPTIFASVPRLLNKIHAGILQKTIHSGSAVTAALFQRGLEAKLAGLKESSSLTHSVWDVVIFNKIKALLGGRIRAITSGSAPILPDVLNFLRVCFSCEVLEGYGASETTSGGSVTWAGDYRSSGKIGPVMATLECKLVDIPEMNYKVTDKPDPRGELLLKGPCVFQGYYNDEEKTKEALINGWYKTGDVCTINKIGHIQIIDRKKNIFKLQQGEYVAPEKLENIFGQCTLISQIFIHGDSLQTELIAIIIPCPSQLVKLGISKGWLSSSTNIPDPLVPGMQKLPVQVEELLMDRKYLDWILEDIRRIGVQEKLTSFEIPKSIYLSNEIMTIDSDLLTPTLKLKRDQVRAKYRSQIDKMYSELEAKKTVNDLAAKL